MEVVEFVLLGFVVFSVIVVSIIHWVEALDEKVKKFGNEQNRPKEVEIHASVSNTRVESVVTKSLRDQQNRSVGGGGDCEVEIPEVSGGEESLQIEEPVQQVTNCSNKLGVSEVTTEDSKMKGNEIHILRNNNEEEEGFLDDWEGVERTELEKRFGDAVVFVGSKNNVDRVDYDLKMQLYGLHKVALEGPCRAPQPMSLKVSARAKWNAWQSLGNMNRELAMEQYVMLLSWSIPGWKGEGTAASQDAGTSDDLASHGQKKI